ncbi:hypothetical protein EBZ35_09025, partial [bacterium]|nr:hypothetical protein [bacterium]
LVVSDQQVSNWFDWSGNRNHMAAPANAKPVFNPNGINNMPSIQFNGIDQYMTGSPGPLVAGDDSYTLFVVWKSISTSPQVLWEQNSATGNVSGQRAAMTVHSLIGFSGEGYDFPTGNLHVTNNVNITAIVRNENATAGNVFVITNGVVSTGNLNDNPDTNLAVSAALHAIGRRANGTQYFNGQIGEVLVFDRDLTPAERWAVETYLSVKWRQPIDSDGDGAPNDMELAPTVSATTTTVFTPYDPTVTTSNWMGVGNRLVECWNGTIQFGLPIDTTPRLSIGTVLGGSATLNVLSGHLVVGTLELGRGGNAGLWVSGGSMWVTGSISLAPSASSVATVMITNQGRLTAPLLTSGPGAESIMIQTGELNIGT